MLGARQGRSQLRGQAELAIAFSSARWRGGRGEHRPQLEILTGLFAELDRDKSVRLGLSNSYSPAVRRVGVAVVTVIEWWTFGVAPLVTRDS